ncbi:hypothetical protein RHSIM_Rhsim02G0094300 [Rhododendron simsii]|uniref:Uncharacterized protein n=1 Tax=Rhododendron simsii TaxID=118357 RepID=A0A834LUK0_RHOSS|nr:hypothetical protein RHSIM_Rhsim02G0094300 [Rhododendron simsii]
MDVAVEEFKGENKSRIHTAGIEGMENGEKKTLIDFCYWGGKRKVNTNDTFFYNGGMCVAVLLEEGSQVNELRENVCGALNINLEGKLYFYNTKRDKMKYVTLNDNNGVAMLFYLNGNDDDLFVEDTWQNNDSIPDLLQFNKIR